MELFDHLKPEPKPDTQRSAERLRSTSSQKLETIKKLKPEVRGRTWARRLIKDEQARAAKEAGEKS